MKRFRTCCGRAAAAGLVALSASPVFAQSTIPDVGVNMETVLTDYGTALGAVVLVAVGLVLAFRLIKKAVRWVFGGA